MTREQRLRRVGLLSLHCLQNLAFYSAGWRESTLVFKDEFWVRVNGNFFNSCVLEWYKLFVEAGGKHHWKKVISDPDKFFSGLLNELKITETDFNTYIDEMKDYRDKFVAHLDENNTMYPPWLEVALKSASYLYDYLPAHEDLEDSSCDDHEKASTFYQHWLEMGESVYRHKS